VTDILEGVEGSLQAHIEIISKHDDKLRRAAFDILNEVKKAREAAHLAAGTTSVPKIPHEIKPNTRGLSRNETEETHESFGVVSVTRPSGGRTRLFGSMVDALPSFVELTIQRAQRTNDPDGHSEFIRHDFKQPVVARIRMSTYQWAELITNMNGTDTPCTLDVVNGVQMDPLPKEVTTPLEQIKQDTKKAFFKEKVADEVEFKAALEALKAQVAGLGLSQKKTVGIQNAIGELLQFVTAPMAAATWASQRLAEDTEKLTSQARIEIAAAMESIVRKAGLQAMQEKGLIGEILPPQLTRGDDE
jgi:hypothetical protein